VKRAHEVLYYVGLEESRYRQVDTYSSGMQQRLKLAQALVHDPKLMLLDEPTSGMDPGGRKEMLQLIKDISDKQTMNIIISSHLLPDIETTCQHVIILNKGRVVSQQAVSSSGEVRFNRFELKIKGDKDSFITRLEKRKCEVEADDRGMLFVMLPVDQSPRDIFRTADQAGIQIRHFRKSRTTLTDTFVNAVGASDGH
jgi:ABC-2 type transport system ATP-binding protein